MISLEQCIQKYNLPVPRYTSYPTVPHWHTQPSPSQWASLVKTAFQHSNQDQGISLYIHLPYCSSLTPYPEANPTKQCFHAEPSSLAMRSGVRVSAQTKPAAAGAGPNASEPRSMSCLCL